jgi:hypothetical protein
LHRIVQANSIVWICFETPFETSTTQKNNETPFTSCS